MVNSNQTQIYAKKQKQIGQNPKILAYTETELTARIGTKILGETGTKIIS